MGLDNVIKFALTLTLIAAMTGQTPRITQQIRLAQLKLLEESKASKWGSPGLLNFRRGSHRWKHKVDFAESNQRENGFGQKQKTERRSKR